MEVPSPSITGRPLVWIKVDAGVFFSPGKCVFFIPSKLKNIQITSKLPSQKVFGAVLFVT